VPGPREESTFGSIGKHHLVHNVDGGDEVVDSAPPNTTLSTFAQGGYTLVAVSNKAEFLVLNTKTGTIGRKMPCPPQVVNLHVSHSLVFSGSSDGLLRTHDLRATTKKSAGTELSVRAHQGSIQAIESSGNWVYTIGWTIRYRRCFPVSCRKVSTKPTGMAGPLLILRLRFSMRET